MKYKCHLCGLESKLNVLLSSHYKKSHSDVGKEQYKRDLLIHNNRVPKICPVCNKETVIPKGEKEYPLYHKKCYLSTISGDKNPNYKGGKTKMSCLYCDKTIYKYDDISSIHFCSSSCAMNYYALPENRTDAQLANDTRGAYQLRKLRNTDKHKIAHAKALAKMQRDKKSKIESRFFE